MLKNKMKYLLLLGALFLLSILYNKYRMGVLLLTMLAMPLFLIAVISYLYLKVKVSLLTTVHVAKKGEAIPISIQINNPTIFPVSCLKIYFTYKNSFTDKMNKKEFIVSLDHNTTTNVTIRLYSEYAGNLELRLLGIRIFDYIKLFSLRKKLNIENRVAVLPNFYEMMEDYIPTHNSIAVESEFFSGVKSGDDPSEVFAIREYREGDRIQRIHWKLSQKQDKLMIKEFSDPINCSMLIFIDLSIPDGEDALLFTDALLECALSLSRFFITNGQYHYFAWYDNQHSECRRIKLNTENEMFAAMDGLLHTQVYPFGEEAFCKYLAEFSHDQYSDVFYITGEFTENSLEAVSIVKASKKHMIYVSDINMKPEKRKNRNNKSLISESFFSKSSEMGINFIQADARNMKQTIEHFIFS